MAIAKTSTKTRSVADRGQEHPFRPIMALKAALEVVDQLTFAILAGWYEPGDKLPIIPELSKAMKVSPPVVGEAIHLLSDARVLDIRRGNQGGITVRSAEIPLSITKLLRPRRLSSALMTVVEARRPVEIAIVRLAAERATEEDFEDLQRTNERLVLARGKPRPWTQAHNAFHYTIGRAAGNVLLAHTQHELLEEIALMLHNFEQRFMDPDRTIREHHDTLAALRTRDPDAAERMMNQQLLEFEELATRFDARKNSRRTSR
jgi:GntR family transcriptional repressor for pyruvate dehydrogenase complex